MAGCYLVGLREPLGGGLTLQTDSKTVWDRHREKDKMKRSMMSLIVLCAVVGCVFFSAWDVQAQEQTSATVKTQVAPAFVPVNRQTSVACQLCFTCGGDWGIKAGEFTNTGTSPVERGGSCSGGLINRADSRPFLCCK